MIGPVNVEELIENSKEKVDFNEDFHYFGEMEIQYQEIETGHPFYFYINGNY